MLFSFLALVVGTGALLLRVVGFSFGKGVLITTTFLFLGFWNPIGWVVLGLCIWLQVRENRDRLLTKQPRPRVPTVEVGRATTASGTGRLTLRGGDQLQRR